MNLADAPAHAELRRRVRVWLQANLAEERLCAFQSSEDETFKQALHDWQRRLFDGGFAAYSWPRKYGGHDGTALDDLVLAEEFARANVPRSAFRIGLLVSRVMLKHARKEQAEFFVPRVINGTHLWAAGFSEPDSGSDVASLRTRAEPIGGGYRISGQKVWSTYAHLAEYCFLLARTNPAAQKHKGLTAFAVKMDTPGIQVRPLKQINGRWDFCEIFFDNAEVPAECVIGDVDQGWNAALTFFDFERRGIADFGFYCQSAYRKLLDLAREIRTPNSEARLIDDASIRRKLAALGAAAKIAVLNNYRFSGMAGEGAPPGSETSVQKLQSTELNRMLQSFGLEMAEMGNLSNDLDHKRMKCWSADYLTSFGWTIAGGTSQIQRTIIAERMLNLPR